LPLPFFPAKKSLVVLDDDDDDGNDATGRGTTAMMLKALETEFWSKHSKSTVLDKTIIQSRQNRGL
jgi:hypothetical protein